MSIVKDQAEMLTKRMRAVTGKRGRIVPLIVRGTGYVQLSLESRDEMQKAWWDGFIYAMEISGQGHPLVDPEDE